MKMWVKSDAQDKEELAEKQKKSKKIQFETAGLFTRRALHGVGIIGTRSLKEFYDIRAMAIVTALSMAWRRGSEIR